MMMSMMMVDDDRLGTELDSDEHAAVMQQQQLLQQHHQQQQQLAQQLGTVWHTTLQDIEDPNSPIDFKSPGLPFARIKKIMKSDDEVRVRLVLNQRRVLLVIASRSRFRDLTRILNHRIWCIDG